MKAIVTGGAGFVPSHLADKLLTEGYEVIIIDSMITGFQSNLENARKSAKSSLIVSDLRNCVNMKFEGVDVIFHMAAYPIRLDKLFDYETYLEQTEHGALSALELARKNDIPLFVMPSSTTMYGQAKVVPTPEDVVGPDSSFYGTAKYNSERWAEAYGGLFGIDVLIDRFGRILGPRSRNGAIWELVHKAKQNPRELRVLGNGSQVRSFLHVSDCIEGMMTSMKNRTGRVDKFNIANDDTATIREMVDILLEELNAKFGDSYSQTTVLYGEEPFGWKGDNAIVFPDSKKLKSWGWSPKMSSQEAVRDCVKWTINEVFAG